MFKTIDIIYRRPFSLTKDENQSIPFTVPKILRVLEKVDTLLIFWRKRSTVRHSKAIIYNN